MAIRSCLLALLRTLQIISLSIVVGLYAYVLYYVVTGRRDIDAIFNEVENKLSSEIEKDIVLLFEDFFNQIVQTPDEIYVVLTCAIWTLLSTLIAIIYVRINHHKNEDFAVWRVVLEILNFFVMAAAFIAAALFATNLDRLCIPLFGIMDFVKEALSLVVPEISGIFNSCPISLVVAAFCGFAAICYAITAIVISTQACCGRRRRVNSVPQYQPPVAQINIGVIKA